MSSPRPAGPFRRSSPRSLPNPLLFRAVLLILAVLPLTAPPLSAATAVEETAAPPGAPPAAPGLAVEGSDHAWLRVDEAVGVAASYANAGYDLEVRPAEDGGTEAVIRVDLAPLGDGGPFTPPTRPGEGGQEAAEADPVAALARRLTARAGTRYEAVSAILGWMVHNVVSEETAALAAEPRKPLGGGTSAPGATALPTAPPTVGPGAGGGTGEGDRRSRGTGTGGEPPGRGGAEGRGDDPGASGGGPPGPPAGSAAAARPAPDGAASGPRRGGAAGGRAKPGAVAPVETVLERGSGNPEEVARLAVALLEAAGLEARTVRGRVVGPPEIGSPHGPHSWIEVRYPPRGWAFSDPLHHHHYVPATYLPFAPGAAVGKGEEPAPVPPVTLPPVTLVERRDRRETVDLYPPGAPGITARKGDPGQRAGALRVVVAGGGRGSAVLEGVAGRTSKMLVGGESVFVGLEGGAYRLEVYLEGRPPIVRELQVGERERRAVYLRKAAGDPSPGEAPTAARGGRSRSPDPPRRGRPYP